MSKLRRIPTGFVLDDGSLVRSLLYEDEEWYVVDTSGEHELMVVASSLSQRWVSTDLLEQSLLSTLVHEGGTFSTLKSRKGFILSPVEGGRTPESKVDGLAFSLALKESRRLDRNSSFHDAIYVEQYSRLLPTWTLTPSVDDETVLGTWLSGGVTISTRSFRRLRYLLGWLPTADLTEIVEAAGLEIPSSAFCPRRSEDESGSMKNNDKRHGSSCFSTTIADGSQGFSLPGRQALETFFNEYVIDIVHNSERYSQLGIGFPSAIVLHGPPGCGKTFAVERLVEYLDWPSFSISSGTVGSPYIHETSRKISEIFNKAIDAAPSLLIIDEMEAFLSERRGVNSGHYHVEEVAEFLRMIPEAGKHQVLVVAMTNMIEMIDPAILRRGRFDNVVEVGMPSKDEVKELLQSLFKQIPTTARINFNDAIESLVGAALSDIAFFARESARLAAKAGMSRIDQQCLDSALKRVFRKENKTLSRIGF